LTNRIEGIDPQLSRVIVPGVIQHPRYLPGLLRLARTLKQSHRVRDRVLADGVRVPPFLVLSVLPDAICVAQAAPEPSELSLPPPHSRDSASAIGTP
jgi:hypothetical protein